MRKRVFWVTLALIFSLAGSFCVWIPTAAAFTSEQKLVLQSWRIVNQSYLDDTFNHQNWWFLRQKFLKKPIYKSEDAYNAIEEMLATLDEPFTRLLRPEQYRSLKVSTSGELSGVGLQINIAPETKHLEVVAPIAGSPAAEAGIESHDWIVQIDGQDTSDLTLDEAAQRMRGRAGTKVTLLIYSEGDEGSREIELIRDRIALNSVMAKLDDTHASPIGYVRLSQFSAHAAQELNQAIAKLDQQNASAYILDLRNNPGGLLQAGIEIARLWLNEGTIVYTVNRQGTLGSFEANDSAVTDKPLVILVNQGTASASEILAGALQDNGRGQLVGEKTFGKGLIQSLFELADGSGLAVTVAKYETPDHKDIHKLGIVPDRIVTQPPIAIDEIGTKADLQYQAAVDLLTSEGVFANAA